MKINVFFFFWFIFFCVFLSDVKGFTKVKKNGVHTSVPIQHEIPFPLKHSLAAYLLMYAFVCMHAHS